MERKSGKRGSNPRPQAWEAYALPTELFPQWLQMYIIYELKTKKLIRKLTNELCKSTRGRGRTGTAAMATGF